VRGINLIDAMVFDDDGHWWSLHELTTGSLAWNHNNDSKASE